MTDTDLGNVFYNITANDQTSGTLAGAAQNFYFMFNSIREGVSMVQTAFDDTVGAAMDYEDSIEHLSITTNTSFDYVQRWKEAATSMGVDFDAFSSTMTMMTQKIGAQGTAGDDLRQRIEALGVSVIDANGNYRSTSDIMQDLLPALSNVGDAQTRDADALAIFGRSWQNIAPMIDDGTTAVNNFKAASPVMSDEDAQKVQNFRIEWGILSERFEIFQDTVGTYIIAFFQDVAQAGAVAGVEISSLGMALDGVEEYIKTGNMAELTNAMDRISNPGKYTTNFLDTTTVALHQATTSTSGAVETAKQQEEAQKKVEEAQTKAEKASAEDQKKADAHTATQTKLAQTIEDNSQKLENLEGETTKTATASADLALRITELKQKINDEINSYNKNATTIYVTVTPPAGSSPTEVGTAVGSAINDQLADTANLRTQRIAMGIGGND
jgi:hypothetical protein